MADTTVSFDFESLVTSCEQPGPVLLAEDSELIEGLRDGREEAYECLIMRYQQPIFNLVYRLVEDPGDTSDIVQEVFIKIFRHVGSFRGQSSLKTWLYRIAVNEAHNHRRWFSRHGKREIGLEQDDGCGARSYQDTLPDPRKSPFDITLQGETFALIEAALSRVKPVFRQAVVLRDIEDLAYDQISEILGVSLGTVKSRILRGREALRRELAAATEHKQAFVWNPQTVEQD